MILLFSALVLLLTKSPISSRFIGQSAAISKTFHVFFLNGFKVMKGVLTLQARARKSTSFPGFSLFLENRHTIAAFDCDGSLVVRGRIKNVYQVPIVQTLDSTIQQKNLYQVDKY